MIAELPWEWKSSVSQKHVTPSPPSPSPSRPKQTMTSVTKQIRFHPHISIWTEHDTMWGLPEDDTIFWFIQLESMSGFLQGSIWDIQRKACSEIASTIVKRKEQGMQLVPLGRKDLQTSFGDCIRCFMTDDRIPVWNPLCLRLIVAASDYNCIVIEQDGSKKLIAPWKQRRKCIVVHMETKKWKIETKTEDEIRNTYPISTWLPKTKTVRQKMEKDDLYLLCTLFNVHPPKLTKKAMLEVL